MFSSRLPQEAEGIRHRSRQVEQRALQAIAASTHITTRHSRSPSPGRPSGGPTVREAALQGAARSSYSPGAHNARPVQVRRPAMWAVLSHESALRFPT